MNIKIEITENQKKYIINGKVYDHLNDVPAEYRSLLANLEKDEIPDSLDGLLKATLKETFSIDQKVTNQTHNQLNERKFPVMLKVGIGVALVLAIALIAFRYSRPGVEPTQTNDEKLPVAVDSIPEKSVPDITGTKGDKKVILIIEDPDKPPYHAFIRIALGDSTLLTIDLPSGETDKVTEASISISAPLDQGTNLLSQVMTVSIQPSTCEIMNDEVGIDWEKIVIKGREFNHGTQGSSGAGKTYSNHYYSLDQNGNCIMFAMELSAVNRNMSDPPVAEFNLADKVRIMEDWLKTIR